MAEPQEQAAAQVENQKSVDRVAETNPGMTTEGAERISANITQEREEEAKKSDQNDAQKIQAGDVGAGVDPEEAAKRAELEKALGIKPGQTLRGDGKAEFAAIEGALVEDEKGNNCLDCAKGEGYLKPGMGDRDKDGIPDAEDEDIAEAKKEKGKEGEDKEEEIGKEGEAKDKKLPKKEGEDAEKEQVSGEGDKGGQGDSKVFVEDGQTKVGTADEAKKAAKAQHLDSEKPPEEKALSGPAKEGTLFRGKGTLADQATSAGKSPPKTGVVEAGPDGPARVAEKGDKPAEVGDDTKGPKDKTEQAIEDFAKKFGDRAGKERGAELEKSLKAAYERMQKPEYSPEGTSPEAREKHAAEQMEKMLGSMDKIMQSDGKIDGQQIHSKEDQNKIIEGLARRAEDPQKYINQGKHSTCALESKQVQMYETNPARAAEIVADIATKGEFKNNFGDTVKVHADSLKLDSEAGGKFADSRTGQRLSDREAFGKGGMRDAAGQMFDVGAGQQIADIMAKAEGGGAKFQYRTDRNNNESMVRVDAAGNKIGDVTDAEGNKIESPNATLANTAMMHKAMDGKVNLFAHESMASPEARKALSEYGVKFHKDGAGLQDNLVKAQKESGASGSMFVWAGKLGDAARSTGHDLHSMNVRARTDADGKIQTDANGKAKFDGMQTWGADGDREVAGIDAGKLDRASAAPTEGELAGPQGDYIRRNIDRIAPGPDGQPDPMKDNHLREQTEEEKRKAEEEEKQRAKEQFEGKDGKDPNKKAEGKSGKGLADLAAARARLAAEQATLDRELAKDPYAKFSYGALFRASADVNNAEAALARSA